jgi:hypothetical protein
LPANEITSCLGRSLPLPVELVGLLKQAGIDGKKLTWDLQVNSIAISVKLMCGITVVSLCLSTCFTVTNGFIPFRLPLVDALSISFPGGRREVFLFLGLAGNLSCFFNLGLFRKEPTNDFHSALDVV